MNEAHQRGALAEDAALSLLREAGLALVTRNYRCLLGEIDLIMRDGDTLVFVEVRCRTPSRFGSGAESIDRRKRGKVVRTAEYYLATSGRGAGAPCRFDVVSAAPAVDERGHGTFALEWIPRAFDGDLT